jgi:hypothetical protein
MSENPMSESPSPQMTGELRVEVRSDSIYFGQRIPVEVRDSNLSIVSRMDSGHSVILIPGPYQVSAVLEDGFQHSKLVNIVGGESLQIEIHGKNKELLDDVEIRQSRRLASRTARSGSSRTASILENSHSLDETENLKLLDVQGASRVATDRYGWIFEGASDGIGIPTAIVRIGNVVRILSLPVTPDRVASPPPNTCVIHFNEDVAHSIRISASITRERVVASALQNMLARGQLLSAVEMAEDAKDLLRYKYSDPTAATLGALILNKVGRLAQLRPWLENLARDFPWIPDGNIFLASQLASNAESMEQALMLAMDACGRRPLFTESFSMLLDLMRRWPEKKDEKLRDKALAAIVPKASRVDWSSMYFNELMER